MYTKRNHTVIRVVSIAVIIAFLSYEFAWAGDLTTSTIDNTLNQMEAQQTQTFAPDYLQAQAALHDSLIDTKQAIEDTISTQNVKTGSEETASDNTSIELKGPRGDGEYHDTTAGTAQNLIPQDGPILSVTTAQGDVIYYRGSRIDSIERWDGAILRDIAVDKDNNLIAAQITYPDETKVFVAGGKVVKTIKPNGAVYNYNTSGLIESIRFADGKSLTYIYPSDRTAVSYTRDEKAALLETAYYSDGRLSKVEYASGRVSDYNDGIIAKIAEPDGARFIFEIKNNPDGTITSNLAPEVLDEAQKIGIRKVTYNSDRSIREVEKADGSVVTYKDGLVEGVFQESGVTSYSYGLNSLGSINETIVDRDGIKRIYDQYGNLQTLTLDGLTKVVYENGKVKEIIKSDGTRLKNIKFRENGELDSALIAYPDGSVAVYEDAGLLQIIGKSGSKTDYSGGKIRRISLEDGTIYDWLYEGDNITIIDRSRREKRTYNEGRLIKLEETNGARLTIKYYYEESSKNLAKSEICKNNEVLYTYTYTYEEGLTLVRDEDGNTQAYRNDKKLSYIIDSKGRKYSYTYVDKKEDAVEVKMPDGARVRYANQDVVLADGTLVEDVILGEDGQVKDFTYIKDGVTYTVEDGSLARAVKPDGTITEYTPNGFISAITAKDGQVTNYEYEISRAKSVGDSMELDSYLDTNQSLLLHLNGDNNSRTGQDSSTQSHPISFNGGAHLDTANKVFGSSSVRLDKNTGDYISIPDSDDWSFGADGFTIDFWVKFNTLTGDHTIFEAKGSGDTYLTLQLDDNNLHFMVRYARAYRLYFTFPHSFTTGEWYHVAIARDGTAESDWHAFIDGQEKQKSLGGGSWDSSMIDPDFIEIGRAPHHAPNPPERMAHLDGWVDEFRVSKGTARWTSGFTPPSSEYKKTLYRLEKTFISNPIELNASRLNTLLLDSVTPPGTGIVIQTRTGETSNPDDGSWSGWQALSGSRIASTAAKYLQYRINLSAIDPYSTPQILGSAGSAIKISYLEKKDDNFSLQDVAYVNAAKDGITSQLDASDITKLVYDTSYLARAINEIGSYKRAPGQLLDIAKPDGTVIKDIAFDGNGAPTAFTYIRDGITYSVVDNKVAKGIKKDGSIIEYNENGLTKSIASPSGKVVYYDYEALKTKSLSEDRKLESYLDPKTSLLLHLDGSDGYPVTLKGDARLDSSNKKFGASSVALDGNGDYAAVPDSEDWHFGTDKFTIDFWVNFNDTANSPAIIGQGSAWANFWAILLAVNGTKFEFYARDSRSTRLYFQSDWAPSIHTWYHVALVRDGNTANDWHVFVNGKELPKTLQEGGYSASIADFNNPLTVGDIYENGNQSLNGQLDEFRVSKGTARWTQNFTPPNSEYKNTLYKTNSAVTSNPIELNASRLNAISLDGSTPPGTAITIETRTGDTSNPDDGSWAGWSSQLASRPARYLQYRVNLATADPSITPQLGAITINYNAEAKNIEEAAYIHVKSDGITTTYDKNSLNLSDLASDSNYLNRLSSDIPKYVLSQTQKAIYFDDNVIIAELTGVKNIDAAYQYKEGGVIGVTDPDGSAIKDIAFDGNGAPTAFTYIRDGVTYSVADGKVAKGIKKDGSIIEYNESGLAKSMTSSYGKVVYYDYETLKTKSLSEDRRLESYLDPKTSLLLHLDGSDSYPVTLKGDARIDSNNKKFGASSVALDGNGDYAALPDSTDWAFGTGDFTIDFLVKFNSLGDVDLAGQGTAWANFWDIRTAVNHTKFELYARDGKATRIWFQYDWVPSTNTWYHIAVVRNGTTSSGWHVFVNGTALTGQSLQSGSWAGNMADLSTPLQIGTVDAIGGYLNGWIDEFRISKGTARWTQNFTPPGSEYKNTLYKTQGTFTSNPIELNATRLNTISLDGSTPLGTAITIETRTGDTSNPDDGSWAGWSSQLASRPARYLQYRAILSTADPSVSPQLSAVKIGYVASTQNPDGIMFVNVKEDGVVRTYSKGDIDLASLVFSPSLIEKAREDIASSRLSDSEKIIIIYDKAADAPRKIVTAAHTVTYFENSLATKVIGKDGTVHIRYKYDAKKNIVKTTFINARKKLEEGYQKAVSEIAAQKDSALTRLTQAEADAKTDIVSKVANIKAQILNERERLTKEKAKYDSSIYDLSEFDRVFRELDEYEVNLVAQERSAYEDLARQVTDARVKIASDSSTALQGFINNDYNKVLGDIVEKESAPVIYHYYRSVLGRDPGEEDLKYWIDIAKAKLKAVTPSEITKYLKGLSEYAERATRKANIINALKSTLQGLPPASSEGLSPANSLTPSAQGTVPKTLGLSPDEVVTLTQSDIDSIISWLESQSLHFGDSAIQSVVSMLKASGIDKSFEDIGKTAILIDILTGVITKDTKGDLVISMYAMRKAAKLAGLKLYSLKLTYDELKALSPMLKGLSPANSLTPSAQGTVPEGVIIHIDGKHFVTITSIDDARGIITYIDSTVGKNGQEITVSRSEFMEMWRGYALSKESSGKLLNSSQEKMIRGSGWWKKFLKGVYNFYNKVISPILIIIGSVLLKTPLMPLGAAILGFNLLVHTLAAVVRVGTWQDVMWAVVETAVAVVLTVAFGGGGPIGGAAQTGTTAATGAAATTGTIAGGTVASGAAAGGTAAASGTVAAGAAVGGTVASGAAAGGAVAAGSSTAASTGIFASIKGAFTAVASIFKPIADVAAKIATGIGHIMTLGAPGVTQAAAQTIGYRIIAQGISLGTDLMFKSMKIDPGLASIGAALTTGAIMGAISPGASVSNIIGESLKYGTIAGVDTLGKAAGLDPNLTHIAAITAGSLVEGGFKGKSYTDIMQDIAPMLIQEATRTGIIEVGELLGIDSRVNHLLSIGISSAVGTGLGSGWDAGTMFQSVTTGLLQGVTSIGLNYATQELGLNPLLANIGYSAISTALQAGIKSGLSDKAKDKEPLKDAFTTYKDNALTYLGYAETPNRGDQKFWTSSADGKQYDFNQASYDKAWSNYYWQESVYKANIMDFSGIVQEKGFVKALDEYATSFFSATAVNSITQTGLSIGEYFKHGLDEGLGSPKILKDGKELTGIAISNPQAGTTTTALFEQKQAGASFIWSLAGKEDITPDGSHLGYGSFGVDPYGKLGYTDANLESKYSYGLTTEQRLKWGLPEYQSISDSFTGRTLSETHPYLSGKSIGYDSYGDYVDAKINSYSQPFNVSLKDGFVKYYNSRYGHGNMFDGDLQKFSEYGFTLEDLYGAQISLTKSSDRDVSKKFYWSTHEQTENVWTKLSQPGIWSNVEERFDNASGWRGFRTNNEIETRLLNEYQKISTIGQTGDIIFVNGRGFLADTTKDITQGPTNHTGMLYVDSNGEKWVLEMLSDTGLQKIKLTEFMTRMVAEGNDIQIGRRNNIDAGAMATTIRQELLVSGTEEAKHIPYNSLNLFGLNERSETSFICSGMIKYVYQKANRPLFVTDQFQYSPVDIYNEIDQIGTKY